MIIAKVTCMDRVPDSCYECKLDSRDGYCPFLSQSKQEVRPYNCPLKETDEPEPAGKKKIVVTLELDTIDLEPTEEQIKADIEQEINCATYSYNVESIEFIT